MTDERVARSTTNVGSNAVDECREAFSAENVTRGTPCYSCSKSSKKIKGIVRTIFEQRFERGRFHDDRCDSCKGIVENVVSFFSRVETGFWESWYVTWRETHKT